MSNEHHRMKPLSGERVEVDGVYENEWGAEEQLKRGDLFPSDLMMGETEWELTEFTYENHHTGRTDPRLVPKANDTDKIGKIDHPRRQVDRGEE
jgi:hypothetical protein